MVATCKELYFHERQCLRMPGTFVDGISLVGFAGIFAAYTEWDGERIARQMIKRALIVEAHCVVCIGGISDT